jgi:hypothetical protein
MKASRFALMVVVGLLLLPVGLAVGGGKVETDDMNDRFAGEKFAPAANGIVQTRIVQDGEITVASVKIHNLPAGREFEVVVVVGPEGETGFVPDVIVDSGSIMIGGNGRLTVSDLEVGKFAVGTYRVDIFVMPPGDGLERDFILACQPAPFVTVGE